MFRLKNKDAKFPDKYEHIIRELPTIESKGFDKIGSFVLRDGVDFCPQVGMQEAVVRSEANLVFACGQATSGKSFALFLSFLKGIGIPNYTAKLINVRKIDSAKGSSMFRDALLTLGQFADCEVSASETPTFFWL